MATCLRCSLIYALYEEQWRRFIMLTQLTTLEEDEEASLTHAIDTTDALAFLVMVESYRFGALGSKLQRVLDRKKPHQPHHLPAIL